MSTQFDAIYLHNRIGKFRVAPSGLGWKATDGEDAPTTVKADDIKYAQWTRVARGFQLQLGLKTGKRIKFDGFEREDHERLSNRLQHELSVQLESREITVRGWNWGKVDVQGADLAFHVGSNAAFFLPLEHVNNSTITKNEVTLEIIGPQVDTSKMTEKELKKKRKTDPDELVEMRLYVPGSASAARRRARKAVKAEDGGDVEMADGSDQQEDESDADDQTAAQQLHDELQDKADLNNSAGTPMVSFSDVHCLTPRGRYDLDLYSTFFRLRNKSYDYKILYSSFSRCFMLPKTDDVNMVYVINLEPPIRQGQTRYPFLVIQFPKDEELKCEIKLDDDERAEFPNLHSDYDAPAYEVVSSIFTALTKKKNVTPSGNFQSSDGQQAIKCNLKTNEGQLYFMEKSLVFLTRQPLVVPYADIAKVRFERVTGTLASARTFDMRIEMRDTTDQVFSAVARTEQQPVSDFLGEKHVKVKKEVADDMVETGAALAAALAADDDDDSSASGSDDDAPKRDKGKAAAGDDDEDSEVDEDFQAVESGSSVAEEYDENYKSEGEESDAMDVDDDSPAKPKADKPKKKKQKKASDAGSGAEAAEAPKKKAKAKPVKSKDTVSDDDDDDDGAGSDAERPKKKPKKE